jgi:hypothetical protein
MKRNVFIVVLLLYLAVWWQQKGKSEWSDYYLSPAPPAAALKIASGYARQLTAFSLFVKVAIFSGGPLKGVDKMSYADNLAQNFDVMTSLYPEFIDSYHYCQSYLASISPEYARQSNKILERAVAEHPDTMYFPFFQAFNYFYYMDEPVKAAEVLFSLSKNPKAPPWFAHFAGTLMARGGNLVAGRGMIQTMLKTEKDEYIKKRYRRQIENFNKAIKVQEALDRYRDEQGRDADSLQDIIPGYLAVLPKLEDNFTLTWKPPLLHLEQPRFPVSKAVREKGK